MRIKMALVVVLAAFAVTGAACGDKKKADTMVKAEEGSLYDRLGKKDGIAKIVDDFVGIVVADVRINAFFANANAVEFKAKLTDQVCEATGGPCKYMGKTMKESHAGMGVDEAAFNALVEDLVQAMTQNNVAKADQDAILGVLGPMKADIVTK